MATQNNLIVLNNLFNLASDVLEATTKITELEVKGEIFLKALQEHEKTVRIVMEQHSQEFDKVIDALLAIIQKSQDEETRKLAIKSLADFSSEAIKQLGETSRETLKNNFNKLGSQKGSGGDLTLPRK